MSESPSLNSVVQEVLDSLVAEMPLAATLGLVVRRMAELGGFDKCGIMLPDPESGRIRLAAGFGFSRDYADRLDRLGLYTLRPGPLGGGPTSYAFETNRLVSVPDVLAAPTFGPWHDLARLEGYRSLVSAPIRVRGNVIGVLNGYSAKVRNPSRGELEATQTLADQAALAVRLATLLSEQHRTIDELTQVSQRLEKQRSTLERSEEIHRRLTAAVIDGSGFQVVATTLAGLLGRSVTIWDANGYLVCSAPETSRKEASPGVRTRLEARWRIRPRPPEAGRAIAIAASEREPALVVAPVLVGQESVGYVSVEELESPVQDLDLMAVEHGATVVALVAARERVARETEDRLHADFLHDLLNGRYGSVERIVERAQHYGLELYDEHRALVIDLDDWSGYQRSRSLSEQDSGLLRSRLLRVIGTTLQRSLPGSLLAWLSDTVTVVSPASGSDALPERMRRAVSAAQAQVTRVASGLTISAGIGSVATDPDELADSYRSATGCLRLLRQLGRTSQCLCVDNLGLLPLVAETRRPAELLRFAERTLGALSEPKDGQLMATLQALLDCGCDVNVCAKRLGVHPNTVRNRMQRIEALTGIDLGQPEQLLQATLANLVLRILQ